MDNIIGEQQSSLTRNEIDLPYAEPTIPLPQTTAVVSKARGREFEELARQRMSVILGTTLHSGTVSRVPKTFDMVSEDENTVGDVMSLKMIKGRKTPLAKHALIAERLWFLQASEAPQRFLVLGGDREVIESWLKKYRNLLDYRYRIYFMDPTGKEELLKEGWIVPPLPERIKAPVPIVMQKLPGQAHVEPIVAKITTPVVELPSVEASITQAPSTGRFPPLQQHGLRSSKRNPSRYRPESHAYIPKKKAPVPVVMQKLQRQAHVEPIVAKITTPVVELSDASKNVTPAEPIIQAEQAHVEPVSAQITTPIVELHENLTPSVEAPVHVEETTAQPAEVPIEITPSSTTVTTPPVSEASKNVTPSCKHEYKKWKGIVRLDDGNIVDTYACACGSGFIDKMTSRKCIHEWKYLGWRYDLELPGPYYECKTCCIVRYWSKNGTPPTNLP